MGYSLPEKVRSLSPYQPVTGSFRIHSDANESCLALEADLWAQVMERLRRVELHRYPDPFATECCALMARRCGLAPEQVVAGNGSDELISLLETCLFSAGDAVATLETDFSMYAFYAHMAQLRPVELRKREDGSIDPDAVSAGLTQSGASALIFSNPCNPTSLLLPREQVERIVRAAAGALVVVDEAYMEFAGEGESVTGLIPRYDNLLVLKTCSKAVGLAGARVGFALGPKKLIDALRCVKSPYNVNALSQAVAAVVLSSPGYVDECARRLREYTVQLQGEIEWIARDYPRELPRVYPSRTNFVYCEAPRAGQIGAALRERGIAVRVMEGHLRISAALPEENRQVTESLRDVLELMREEESK